MNNIYLAKVTDLVAVILETVGKKPEGILSSKNLSWAYSHLEWMIHTHTLSKMTIFIKST